MKQIIRYLFSNGQNNRHQVLRVAGQRLNQLVYIVMYPNPAFNKLRVTIPATWHDKKVNYCIYNSDGQVVKQLTANRSGQTEGISITELEGGMYTLQASAENETAVQQFVKSK